MKKCAPLAVLIALGGLSIFGLVFEHTEPNHSQKPAMAENGNGPQSEAVAPGYSNQDEKKGNQKSNWIEGLFDKPTDTLLVIFNALLALFTFRLYQATAGLFEETAGLRQAANDQRVDMLKSIKAAEDSARAAERAADISEKALLDLESAYIVLDEVSFEIQRAGTAVDGSFCDIKTNYKFKNIGRSYGTITNVMLASDIFASDVFQEKKMFSLPQNRINQTGRTIFAAGEPLNQPRYWFQKKLSMSEVEEITSGRKCPVFGGEITFISIAGGKAISSFCVRGAVHPENPTTLYATADGCEALNKIERLKADSSNQKDS